MPTFCIGKGLGKAKFVQLQAVLEIAQRHLFESMWRGDSFSNPTETHSYLSTRLRGYTFEVFATLFLDIAIARSRSRNCFAAPLMVPTCIRAK